MSTEAENADIPSARILFQRSPIIAQMSDPLHSDWNRSLTESLSAHELTGLIDFSVMNTVFQNFLEVVGLPVAIIDFDGRVLASSKWQRLCMEFHRSNPTTLTRCLESDRSLSRQMQEGKKYAMYRCLNGLTDCASPIVIDGQHIANLFIGQFLLEPPNFEYFARQQEESGFAKEAYFKALAEVPIIAEEKILAILNLLSGLAHQIAQQSLAEKRTQQAYASVEQQVVERTLELQASHQLLKKLSEQVPGVIYQFRLYPNGTSCFPYASDGIYEIFGVSAESVRDSAEPVFARVHPDDIERVKGVIQRSAESLSPWHDEYRVILPRQGVLWREGQATPEKLSDGSTLWHGFITDITARKASEEAVQHMAFYDRLTDLPNRRLLEDRLHQLIGRVQRNGGKLALLFIDLDKFKSINDEFGHATGDWLLHRVAERIQEALRQTDTVARIGGDEFIVLLPDAAVLTEAIAVAEKIRTSLEMPFASPDGNSLQISSSIGVVMYPDHADNAGDLLRLGDEAMYRAKKFGRNAIDALPQNLNVLQSCS